MSCIWVKHPIAKFFFLLLLFSGCDAYRPKAYITPDVHLNKRQAEMGTPLEVEYEFKTAPDFPGLKKDLTVFVHFLDSQKNIRFVDDHRPPILTNQWVAGKEYRYIRTVFIPENIPHGEYTIEIGMYTPVGKGERLSLNAKQTSERSYEVGKFLITDNQVLRQTVYVEGWYDIEREQNNNWWHWRWTGRQARARLPNPQTDSFLYLQAQSERNRFVSPQTISLYLDNDLLDEFALPTTEPAWKKYEIPLSRLGNNPYVEVKIQVDQTFVPGSSDSRTLGVKVYCLYLGKQRD